MNNEVSRGPGSFRAFANFDLSSTIVVDRDDSGSGKRKTLPYIEMIHAILLLLSLPREMSADQFLEHCSNIPNVDERTAFPFFPPFSP